MSNSPLIAHTNLSPNYTPRQKKIDVFTPHVVVGHASLRSLGDWFSRKTTEASSNYGIDDDGNIGMFVEEKNRSWCTSSPSNDHRAITVEVASDSTSPYKITNGAMDGLIELAIDVCQRNGMQKLLWKADKSLIGMVDKQNITSHRWFANKACPGQYLYDRLGEVVEEVNKILIPLSTSAPAAISGFPYQIMVNTEVLHYRLGPGTDYPVSGKVRKGDIYTIIEERSGLGSSRWGRLKSGAGWISLDYCTKVG